jgi:hypothetical protein
MYEQEAMQAYESRVRLSAMAESYPRQLKEMDIGWR